MTYWPCNQCIKNGAWTLTKFPNEHCKWRHAAEMYMLTQPKEADRTFYVAAYLELDPDMLLPVRLRGDGIHGRNEEDLDALWVCPFGTQEQQHSNTVSHFRCTERCPIIYDPTKKQCYSHWICYPCYVNKLKHEKTNSLARNLKPDRMALNNTCPACSLSFSLESNQILLYPKPGSASGSPWLCIVCGGKNATSLIRCQYGECPGMVLSGTRFVPNPADM